MSTISSILDLNKGLDNQHKYQEFQTTNSPEKNRHTFMYEYSVTRIATKSDGIKKRNEVHSNGTNSPNLESGVFK